MTPVLAQEHIRSTSVCQCVARRCNPSIQIVAEKGVMILDHQLVSSLRHAVEQRLREWTQPQNHAPVLNGAPDITRSGSELVMEHALLRQQPIVLECWIQRPHRAKLANASPKPRALSRLAGAIGHSFFSRQASCSGVRRR